jgi:hypothetical protein
VAILNYAFGLQIEALTGDDPIGWGIDEREATEVINTVRMDCVTSARVAAISQIAGDYRSRIILTMGVIFVSSCLAG